MFDPDHRTNKIHAKDAPKKILQTIGIVGLVLVLLVSIQRREQARQVLIIEQTPQILATPITPITNIASAKSGMVFSGESYQVACTVSGQTTLYPAVYLDSVSAWRVYQGYSCALDSTVASQGTCIFPANAANSQTWNAFKTGSGSVSNCTAEGRAGPVPAGSRTLLGIYSLLLSFQNVAWIDTLYWSGDGTSFSYNENFVSAFTPSIGITIGSVSNSSVTGYSVILALTRVSITLNSPIGADVTITARQSNVSDYVAAVTITAGNTTSSWSGSVSGVQNLIWKVSTTGLQNTSMTVTTIFAATLSP